jgi:uncharacterized damage-inducible protein DinB
MKPLLSALSIAVACSAALAVAMPQTPAPATSDPVSAGSKVTFGVVSGYLTRSAEKVDESLYAFKPMPEVRSFGQIIGHVADANYAMCAAAQGEKPPVSGIEKSATTKTDLVKALADAFAYCGRVYGSMTDAKGAEVVPFFDRKMARISILDLNTAHDYEHYGNLVTYMRLKGIVPPSSEKPMR